MKSIATPISSSVHSEHPPFGGIALKPSIALRITRSRPFCIRLAHSAASPALGELTITFSAAWQPRHADS